MPKDTPSAHGKAKNLLKNTPTGGFRGEWQGALGLYVTWLMYSWAVAQFESPQ